MPHANVSLPPIIAFIGWHNAGKSTLTRRVLVCLKARGYRVAVIKSSKEANLCPDRPGSDSALYWEKGADQVALLGPDQLLVRSRPAELDLQEIVRRNFHDVDLVLAEGFKHATGVPKIEVRRDTAAPRLYGQVPGVLAVISDEVDEALHLDTQRFRLDEIEHLTDWLETSLLNSRQS